MLLIASWVSLKSTIKTKVSQCMALEARFLNVKKYLTALHSMETSLILIAMVLMVFNRLIELHYQKYNSMVAHFSLKC